MHGGINWFMGVVLAAILGLSIGCDKKADNPDYTITQEVLRRKEPPPILINPTGTNVDGMTGFQTGSNQFLMSQDKDALVRSVVADTVAVRNASGNTQVRIGNGKCETRTPEVEQLRKELEAVKFVVTVVPKAAD